MKISLTEYDAALAEERLEPVELEFLGETFTIANSKLWPDTVAGAIADNDLERVFSLMLGPGELERLREAGTRSKVGHLSLGHLEWLMEQIAETLGLGNLGIAGWRAYCIEHWRTLEPDFQRFYGLNFATCLASTDPQTRLSTRRLARLIEGLPLEAATVQAALSDEERARTRWRDRDELALVTFNLFARWRYEWLLSTTDRRHHHQIPEPEPIRRPWETTALPALDGPPPLSSKDEVRAFFGRAITYTPPNQPTSL